MSRLFRRHRRAFTLVELLVSMVALALFILIVTQLVNSASTITTIGNKHMGADSEARSVLDRMAVDFSQIVKRTDVDYFLKGAAGGTMSGNDQIAFYSQVPGYYASSSSASSQSPVSLVGYRLNSTTNQLQRTGNGLLWNGVSATDSPVVFMPLTIVATWPAATNMSQDTSDPVVKNYELIGPQIFRFEYYYLIKGQTVGGTTYSSILSYTPWDTRITGHTAVNALQDVSAIGVTIAVIDPQSRVLAVNQLGTLITQMNDFSPTMKPGDLDAQWQSAVNATTDPVPRTAASAIRIYSRLFPITH